MARTVKTRILPQEEYERWDAFVDTSPQGSLFNKSWWLSTVSSDFSILACEDGSGRIIGGIALPRYYGTLYKNPPITTVLGVLLGDFSDLKNATRYSKEIEIVEEIVASLPRFRLFDYGFSYRFTNALPFKWAGFSFDLGCTYVIEDLSAVDALFDDFKTNIKTDVRKAAKNGVSITDALTIDDFYAVHRMTFQRQSMEVSYGKDFVLGIERTLAARNARKMLFAVDEAKRIHAAAYIVHDARCAYYFMGGGDPALRNSGATSLVIWEAIRFAATVSREFNFEGSSVPSIERFFRAFGGEQRPYHIIRKSSAVTRMALSLLRTQRNLIYRFRKLP